MSTTHRTTPNAPPSLHTTPSHIFFYGYELQIPELTFQQWYPASFDEPAPPKDSTNDTSNIDSSPLHSPNPSTIRFPTAEHYMVYHKALTMHDTSTASAILLARTPLEANTLGRQVKNYDAALWKREREKVAENGNYLKFSQVRECREALLASGDKVIVEASPTDRVWGIGFAGDEAEGRESEWGENVLGKALMRVRSRLRREGVVEEGEKEEEEKS